MTSHDSHETITAQARTAMAAELARDGWLRSEAWQDAFREVPRHPFVPRFFRLTPDMQRYEAIDQHHPEWLRFVYANTVLTTQLDGDDARWRVARGIGPVQGVATCSSTQPSLMASMLEALDFEDGHHVLEVGTGTGYNAALLSHRLGARQVTSIEYDRGVARRARHALHELGYRPMLITGDGDEDSAGGLYDRLVATYSVTSVPPAWLAQVRPGGVIVTSLYGGLDVGLMVKLVVDDDGSAHGHVLADHACFMPTRTHPRTATDSLLRAAAAQPPGTTRLSTLPEPLSDPTTGWAVLAGLLLPDVVRMDIGRHDGGVQWLLAPDGSWAYFQTIDNHVEQGGPRALWNHIENIFRYWRQLGGPDEYRLGLSVSTDGVQQIWLDNRMNTIDYAGAASGNAV